MGFYNITPPDPPDCFCEVTDCKHYDYDNCTCLIGKYERDCINENYDEMVSIAENRREDEFEQEE